MHFTTRTHNRGFTAFFAILVSSLALSIGLTIFDLLIREATLSQTARESQYAIYAADTGAECGLYWDNKYLGIGFTSIFAAPVGVTGLGASTALCNSQDIYTLGTAPAAASYKSPPSVPNGWSAWAQSSSTLPDVSLTVVTTFTIALPTGCATVVVTKVGNPAVTTIVSHGYNTCLENGAVRLERALQVSY